MRSNYHSGPKWGRNGRLAAQAGEKIEIRTVENAIHMEVRGPQGCLLPGGAQGLGNAGGHISMVGVEGLPPHAMGYGKAAARLQ